MIEIRKCPNCGEENNPADTICAQCGYDISKVESSTIDEREIPSISIPGIIEEAPATKTETKFISRKTMFIITGLLVALTLGNLFFSGVYSEPKPEKAIQNSLKEDPHSGNNNLSNNNPHSNADMGALQEITNLQKVLIDNPEDYKSRLALAHLLNDNGFLQKAIEHYTVYLEKYPDEPDVLVDCGVCFYENGESEKAIKFMQKAITINPNHQIAHFNIGIVKFSMENKSEAIDWWKKTIEINPNTAIAKKANELINAN